MRYFIVYYSYRLAPNYNVCFYDSFATPSKFYPSKGFLTSLIHSEVTERFVCGSIVNITSIQELSEQDFNDFNS